MNRLVLFWRFRDDQITRRARVVRRVLDRSFRADPVCRFADFGRMGMDRGTVIFCLQEMPVLWAQEIRVQLEQELTGGT